MELYRLPYLMLLSRLLGDCGLMIIIGMHELSHLATGRYEVEAEVSAEQDYPVFGRRQMFQMRR
jgi:hypothetical protein